MTIQPDISIVGKTNGTPLSKVLQHHDTLNNLRPSRSLTHRPLKPLPLPPSHRQRRTPYPREKVLALILILTIKLHLILPSARPTLIPQASFTTSHHTTTTILIFNTIPLPTRRRKYLLRLQDILPNFIPLRLLLRGIILPPEHGPAERAADIADRVRARDELPRHRLVRACIGEAGAPFRAVPGLVVRGGGVRSCHNGGGGNEIGAAVAAGEPFTDDLGGGAEVGGAAGAAEMRGMTG